MRINRSDPGRATRRRLTRGHLGSAITPPESMTSVLIDERLNPSSGSISLTTSPESARRPPVSEATAPASKGPANPTTRAAVSVISAGASLLTDSDVGYERFYKVSSRPTFRPGAG